MKKQLLIITGLLLSLGDISGQTLTLVTGKKLYEHHSSDLSGAPYGYVNSNGQSGYDFVNHAYVASGNAALAANRDMLEHNGYFSWNGTTFGWKFGFTSATSSVGNFNYQGNNQTKFYLNNAVNFASLNTVNDLMVAYDSTLAKKMDTAVVTGNVYIVKVRNSDMYLAMRITNVVNLTAAEVNALDNNQQVMASVFFEFEYKYGTLCNESSMNVISSKAEICVGQTATLTVVGPNAFSYMWSDGSTGNELVVNPTANTTYTVTGTNMGCMIQKTILQKVSVCTGLQELESSLDNNVYPNPFDSVLKMKVAGGSHLLLTDALGKVVIENDVPEEEEEVVFDTQKLANGFYTLTVVSNGNVYKKKLIKD